MTWTEMACDQIENVNPFLANAMAGETRQAFLAHLATCDLCTALLRALREDEVMARAPLSATERGQVAVIVREARDRLSEHLDSDHRARERGREATVDRLAPRFFLPERFHSWRVLFWAAASLAAAALAWWVFSR